MTLLQHISLFSGIGGFDLAAEAEGFTNIANCEISPFCNRILKYYFPNAKQLKDITQSDFTIYRNRGSKRLLLTGGFPCQPFSVAGKRSGTNDGRYLWPEYLRAIQESRPDAIIAENVTGILSMEKREMFARVDSRNIVRFEDYDHYEAVYTRQSELLLEGICQDLEKEGYKVQPFIIPAASVGAPHRRDRIWIVAHCNSEQRKRTKRGFQPQPNDGSKQKTTTHAKHNGSHGPKGGRGNGADSQRTKKGAQSTEQPTRICKPQKLESISPNPNHFRRGRLPNQSKKAGSQKSHELSGGQCRVSGKPNAAYASHTKPQGSQQQRSTREKRPIKGESRQFSGSVCDFWQNFPTQPPICGRNDGLPTELVGITFSAWRRESIKGYGNAVVPQVAQQLIKSVKLYL